MDTTITPASIDDAEVALLVARVQDFYVERYGAEDATPISVAEFEPPVGAFFVLRVAGAAVAMGGWRWRRTEHFLGTSELAEIKRMYVVPEAQRRGHARAMLAHLEDSARAAGARAVILESGTRQPEALGLYASAGYTRIAPYGTYRCEPESVCLGKRLDP